MKRPQSHSLLKYTSLVIRSFLLSAIIVACFSKIPVARSWAASVNWVGGTDNNWSTAANWSTGVVPTSSDDVLIDVSTTVNIASSITVQSLVLGNSSGTTTPILNFNYDAITNGALIVSGGTLHIYSGGKITHATGTTAVVGTININVTTGDFIIESGGSIDVSGKGYRYAAGPGAGVTKTNTNASGGGAHGGNGENSTTGTLGGTAYGSITTPTQMGSGGGGTNAGYSSGGGAILLNVYGTFTNNGAIAANGTNGGASTFNSYGGGAGGTINITCIGWAGTGSMTTNGGNGVYNYYGGTSGGGSGGRIAINYTNKTYTGTLSSKGGSGNGYGGAGSIFTKSVSNDGDLLYDGSGSYGILYRGGKGISPITTTETFNSLTVSNYATVGISSSVTVTGTLTTSTYGNLKIQTGGSITYGSIAWNALITDDGGTSPIWSGTDISIPSGGTFVANTQRSFTNGTVDGTITHQPNSFAETYKVNLTFTGDLTVSATGNIDVSGKGYSYNAGTGAGTNASGGSAGGGGGYGGGGGTGDSGYPGGTSYGSITNPQSSGSGGGSTYGGYGGGVLLLNVGGTLTNNGNVKSNGINGTTNSVSGGGGAGGSLNMTIGTLAGSGTISANGANGGPISGWSVYGGGGGGGRIAINYASKTFSGSITAKGGLSASTGKDGGPGTVFTKSSGTNGDLLFDDTGTANTLSGKGYSIISSTETFDNVTITTQSIVEISSSVTITNSLNMALNGYLRIQPTAVVSYTTLTWSSSTIVDNGGTLPLWATNTNLTVPAGDVLNLNLQRTFNNVLIDGTLTHIANTTAETNQIRLTINNDLTVSSTGSIDASGKGYIYNAGPGAGVTATGGASGGGAAYGALGGNGDSGINGGTPYGSITNPQNAGSGGGSGTGGNGGGIIVISIGGTLTNNGNIRSNGANGISNGSTGGGAGSGGTINISCNTFAGNGAFSVNGGNGGSGGWSGYGGGGSGGRIALTYTNKSFTGTITARGGKSGSTGKDGGPGSIFTKAYGTNGDLTYDNTGTTNTLSGKGYVYFSSDETFDNVYVSNLATVEVSSNLTITNSLNLATNAYVRVQSAANITYTTLNWTSSTLVDNGGALSLWQNNADLTILSGNTYIANTQRAFHNGNISGTITNYANSSSEKYKVNFTFSGDLSITSTGKIDVSGLGYAATYGPGAGTSGAGGTHGGIGAGNATATYDSESNPVNLGSGGAGAAGGGAVILSITGALTNNGSIKADGASNSSGGGAGGAINITANTFTGTGAFSANGGNGGNGGGGGRIAIITTSNSYSGTFTANGGTSNGGTGTIYPNTFNFENSTSNITRHEATITSNMSLLPIDGVTDKGLIWGTDTSAIIARQPAHAYYLDESTNTEPVLDSVGNINGTSTSTTVISGKVSNARSFNGSSDYISIGSGYADFSGGLTISMWVYPTSTASWARFLDFGNGSSNNNILLCRNATSSTLHFEVYHGTTGQVLEASNAIEQNKWQFFTATISPAGQAKLYKNGVLLNTGTITLPNNVTRTKNYLGKSNWAADSLYAGYIDNVAFYNEALPQNEIISLYNNGSGIENYISAYSKSFGGGTSTAVMSNDLTELLSGTSYFFKPYTIYHNSYVYGDTTQFTTQFDNFSPTALGSSITNAENIYAGKTINIPTIYSDTDGTSDLDKLYLQLKNPSGTDIEYYANSSDSPLTNQVPTAISGSQYISNITYDITAGTPNPTDVTVTWHITPGWDWSRDTNIQYGVKALDKKSAESSYDYTVNTYTYENRLTFLGTIQAVDSNGNTIADGGWTPANFPITFNGIKVVYAGTSNVYPNDDDFDVNVVNDEAQEWQDTTSSGNNISIDAVTPDNTNTNDAYTFHIINIPTGGSDISNTVFTLRTDKTIPVISVFTSSTHPNQNTWYTSANATMNWTATDNQSGISGVWRLIDQTEAQSESQILSSGTQDISSGTYQTTFAQDGVWYMHLTAVDNENLKNTKTYIFHIDTQNPQIDSFTSSTHPSQTTWYSNKAASFNWITSDTGSGMQSVWKMIDQNSTHTAAEVIAQGTQSDANTTWTTPELTNGTWYLHIAAKDNTNKTAYANYKLQIDASTPDIVAVTGKNNGIWQNIDAGPVISWTDPNSPSDDTFYITNDGSLPTSLNYTYTTNTAQYDLPNQKQGETTIKVRALNGAGTYGEARDFVVRYDTIAPANPTGLNTTSTNDTITLTWINPTALDFNKIIVVRNESHIPLSTTDGAKIYEGKSNSYKDTPLPESTQYYYTIFAVDLTGNTSSGTTTSAKTSVSEIPTTPTTTPATLPITTEQTKVIKVEELPTENKVTITADQQKATTTNTGDVHVYTQQTIDIEVPADTIKAENVDKVLLVVDNQTYVMKYDAEKNTYKAAISTPTVKGVYDTTIHAVSNDNISKLAITMSLKVDPYGYIYTKTNGNETRIANATVMLYTKADGKEILWQSTSESVNPQSTNSQGEYGFFVEPGEYKIVVEANGYKRMETEWFTVETNTIEKNIEIKKAYNLPLIIGIGAGILLSISLPFILKRLKKIPSKV